MKKIISVIVSLIMMLSVSACAAGIEIGINSVTLVENDAVVMQLDDPGFRLAFAEGENGAGLRAAMEADGQTALEAIVTLGAEKIFAKATGISDVYSIGMEAAGMLAQTAMSTVSSAGIELTEADMVVVGQIVETATAAAQNGMYYSEDGSTMGVTIADADIRALLAQVVELAKNHPELLAMAELTAEDLDVIAIPENIEISVDASLTQTDAGMTAQLAVFVVEGDITRIISLEVETDMASYVSLTGSAFENESVVMAANVVIGFTDDDGAWLIPADTASVDVMTMDEAQLEKLMTEAQAILSMFGL